MKNTTRKVLILKNVNSEIIEQAILILKDSAPDEESFVIREAEKVVEKYMDKKEHKGQEEKSPKKMFLLTLGVAVISLGMIIAIFFV